MNVFKVSYSFPDGLYCIRQEGEEIRASGFHIDGSFVVFTDWDETIIALRRDVRQIDKVS